MANGFIPLGIQRSESDGYTQSDCDSCSDRCPAESSRRSAHTAWARRHLAKNPSHTVFVVTEKTTVYRGEEARIG